MRVWERCLYNKMDIFSIDKEYVANTYSRFPVQFSHGSGSIVYDNNGKRYIDFCSGIATNIFGLCDTEYINAVEKQLHRFAHASNLYYTEPCAELAKLLCERTGMKKVFFGNSGAEANEGAIKAARKYSFDKYGAGRNKIVTLKNSFHGRTITTLAATGQDVFHNYFFPFTEGFDYAEANNITDTLERLDGACAVMIELVQGEGGVNVLDKAYVDAIYEKCKSDDILLIVDEVQTGNGRCGALYAYMNYGITPDIVSTAKGLGGGLPIGAVLLGEKVENTLAPGTHGSTFGGNPVCAAGAYSVISRIDDALLDGVNRKSEYIKKTVADLLGRKADGMGLLLGIKTSAKASDVVNECIKHGVLALTAKDKIRLLPALNIPDDVLKEGIETICNVIKELEK